MEASASNASAFIVRKISMTSWCPSYLMGVTDILTASREGRDKGGLCGAFYVTAELGPIHLTQMPQMSYLGSVSV